MNIKVLTIFPEMFYSFWESGIIRRAIEQQKIVASAVNIRDFAQGSHKTTDDRPYGGGSGMVMKPEPLSLCIQSTKAETPDSMTILLTPQGRVFDQKLACELSCQNGLILVCGRYEGIDERICLEYIDQEISIGDYILTGGEPAAMVVMDAVVRLIPGVLGNEESSQYESFSEDLLEHAHYTRPALFEGMNVPEVLLSGHHKNIEEWRLKSSLIRTFLKRPDLLAQRQLSFQEAEILKSWRTEIEKIIESQYISGSDSLSGH